LVGYGKKDFHKPPQALASTVIAVGSELHKCKFTIEFTKMKILKNRKLLEKMLLNF
jgi:hypothetical protein